MPLTRTFTSLFDLADNLRNELENKKYILLYAYNSTGKTRLSMAFKNLGKIPCTDGEIEPKDTLYYNAFTEDLFIWDNDLENNNNRMMKLNERSRFFEGLHSMEMETRIRPLLGRYTDIDFSIDTTNWEVTFDRKIRVKESIDEDKKINDSSLANTESRSKFKTYREEAIKVSRGEENIFIWCFFLAIIQLVLDDDGNGPYNWVKYIYIDDPISSLDEHNAISVAHDLAKLLKSDSQLKIVISTHHTLFFNVLCNELKNASKYFLSHDKTTEKFILENKTDVTPFFQHLTMLKDLYEADRTGRLYTYHFNMLRTILEKTANFHGYRKFSESIRLDDEDEYVNLHTRMINILNHGDYSLFEPIEMQEETKRHFRTILDKFIKKYPFNPTICLSDNN